MANHKSALKRHRQSLIRRARNRSAKSFMKTSIKSLLKAVEEKDREAVKKQLQITSKVIDKTASKGIIKKTTASRKIARLAKRANSVLQAAG